MCSWAESMAATSNQALQKVLGRRRNAESALEIFLVHESARGNASEWAPYLAMLPNRVPLSWQFSESELTALQDDMSVKTARERLKSIKAQYERVKLDLRQALVGIKGLTTAQINHWNSFEVFAWACSVTASRATSIKGEMYLVPYSDMIGYSPSRVRAAACSCCFVGLSPSTTHSSIGACADVSRGNRRQSLLAISRRCGSPP